MRNLKSLAPLCCMAIMFAACGDNATQEKKTETTTADTLPKAKWNDPGKSKIYDKTNFVQIPLTAYENHIFGEVKSVTYKDYKVGEDGKQALEDSGYNVYDKLGHLVDQNEYNANGKAKWNCVYKYEGACPVEWVLKFDKAKQNSTIAFKCDDKGRKTEENHVAADKDMSKRLVYKYDDKGNMIEESEYSGEGKAPWTTTYKYDDKGNQLEYVHRDETGRVLRKMTQEYDNLGNKVRGALYRSDTDIQATWTSAYDSKGRRVESTYYKKDGQKQRSTTMKYDDWDNVTEYMSYKADGSIDSAGFSYFTEFEYDAKGNATKETWYKLKDGKKVMTDISEKKYEYY